jgi:FkbM family methyltransferase
VPTPTLPSLALEMSKIPPVSGLSKLLQKIPHFRGRMRIVSWLLKSLGALNKSHRVTTVTGAHYLLPNLSDPISLYLYANGAYEPETVAFLASELPPNSMFMDIGANIGSILIPLMLARPDLRAVAVEAAAAVHANLATNIALNGLNHRVTLVQAAVSDQDTEEVAFFSPTEGFGRGSMAPAFTRDAERVKTIRLETLLDGIAKDTALIKIDVEGFEKPVMSSAGRYLTAIPGPEFLFEVCYWAEELAGSKPGDSQRLMLDAGFHLSRMSTGAPLAEPILCGGAEMIYAHRIVSDPSCK